MDKCTFCAGGPENDEEVQFKKYGRNHLAEGKLPLCAEMCATKALLAGAAIEHPGTPNLYDTSKPVGRRWD